MISSRCCATTVYRATHVKFAASDVMHRRAPLVLMPNHVVPSETPQVKRDAGADERVARTYLRLTIAEGHVAILYERVQGLSQYRTVISHSYSLHASACQLANFAEARAMSPWTDHHWGTPLPLELTSSLTTPRHRPRPRRRQARPRGAEPSPPWKRRRDPRTARYTNGPLPRCLPSSPRRRVSHRPRRERWAAPPTVGGRQQGWWRGAGGRPGWQIGRARGRSAPRAASLGAAPAPRRAE